MTDSVKNIINTYYIGGSPCSGKSTIAEELSKKYNLYYVKVDDYCNRPDHQGFSDFINSASDTGKAKAVCNETVKSLNEKYYKAIKDSDYYWIERTPESTVEETVEKDMNTCRCILRCAPVCRQSMMLISKNIIFGFPQVPGMCRIFP